MLFIFRISNYRESKHMAVAKFTNADIKYLLDLLRSLKLGMLLNNSDEEIRIEDIVKVIHDDEVSPQRKHVDLLVDEEQKDTLIDSDENFNEIVKTADNEDKCESQIDNISSVENMVKVLKEDNVISAVENYNRLKELYERQLRGAKVQEEYLTGKYSRLMEMYTAKVREMSSVQGRLAAAETELEAAKEKLRRVEVELRFSEQCHGRSALVTQLMRRLDIRPGRGLLPLTPPGSNNNNQLGNGLLPISTPQSPNTPGLQWPQWWPLNQKPPKMVPRSVQARAASSGSRKR